MSKVSPWAVWVVLKREFGQRVYSRSFLGSTILIPGLLVAMVVVPALLRSGSAPTPRIPAGVHGHVEVIGAVVAASILLYVLFVSVFTYGAIVMRAVLDEKQSRVLELMLCFASPDELMAGKILGVGAVALAQVMIWIAMAGVTLAASPPMRGALVAMHLGGSALVFFIVFDLLGYLFYSSIFCAIGAAFNSADEAQQWTLLMVLPLVVTGMLLPTTLTAPDSTLSAVASMVPFTAPALMYARVVIGHPEVWQVALAIALLIGSIAATIQLCARIYRVGILMYGKRPTIREIARWISYAQ